MRIVSQNLLNYDIKFPSETIMRINLAWVESIDSLKKTLDTLDFDIFLDLPVGRIKPPNNKYELDDLAQIISHYSKIKYFAISNVEDGETIDKFRAKLPNSIILVPKIESIQAIKNFHSISSSLEEPKIMMLDHDDLFSDVVRNNQDSEFFTTLIDSLLSECKKAKIILLRTQGVIFSEII